MWSAGVLEYWGAEILVTLIFSWMPVRLIGFILRVCELNQKHPETCPFTQFLSAISQNLILAGLSPILHYATTPIRLWKYRSGVRHLITQQHSGCSCLTATLPAFF
jgi:hypothetical protein